MALDHEVIDPSTYGLNFDDDGPVTQLQTNNNVEVPRSSVELTDEDRAILALSLDRLVDDGNHGIHLYLQTMQIITALAS